MDNFCSPKMQMFQANKLTHNPTLCIIHKRLKVSCIKMAAKIMMGICPGIFIRSGSAVLDTRARTQIALTLSISSVFPELCQIMQIIHSNYANYAELCKISEIFL